MHKYGDPRYTPYFDSVVAAYEEANPGVTIDVMAETDQGVKDKLRVLAASNTLPDVYFSWAGDFTKKFVRGGLAKELTEDVAGDWQASFTPAALDAYTYDGKLYGVPITLDAKYLVFNNKCSRTAGSRSRRPWRSSLRLRCLQGAGHHGPDRVRQPVRLAGDPLHDPAERLLRPTRHPRHRLRA